VLDPWTYERQKALTAAMMDALGRWEVARGEREIGRRLLLLSRDLGLDPTESLMSPSVESEKSASHPTPIRR
jgi:hypothetical protein